MSDRRSERPGIRLVGPLRAALLCLVASIAVAGIRPVLAGGCPEPGKGAREGGGPQAEAEPEHIRLTRRLGKASLELSRAAEPRLQDPNLRAFAKAEIAHEADNERTFGSQKDRLDPPYAEALRRLSAMDPGRAHDDFYRLIEEDALQKLRRSYAAYKKRCKDDMAYTISSIGQFQIQDRIDRLNGAKKDD